MGVGGSAWHKNAYKHANLHPHTHTPTHPHTHTCTRAHTHTHTHIYTYTRAHTKHRVKLELQGQIFKYFLNTLEVVIQDAKSSNKYSEGIVDCAGESITLNKSNLVCVVCVCVRVVRACVCVEGVRSSYAHV